MVLCKRELAVIIDDTLMFVKIRSPENFGLFHIRLCFNCIFKMNISCMKVISYVKYVLYSNVTHVKLGTLPFQMWKTHFICENITISYEIWKFHTWKCSNSMRFSHLKLLTKFKSGYGLWDTFKHWAMVAQIESHAKQLLCDESLMNMSNILPLEIQSQGVFTRFPRVLMKVL